MVHNPNNIILCKRSQGLPFLLWYSKVSHKVQLHLILELLSLVFCQGIGRGFVHRGSLRMSKIVFVSGHSCQDLKYISYTHSREQIHHRPNNKRNSTLRLLLEDHMILGKGVSRPRTLTYSLLIPEK